MDLFTHAEALAARDRAIAKHDQGAARQRWIAHAREIARMLCAKHGEANINQVRALAGDPPPGADGRIMGAVFHRSEFVVCGYVRSLRKECNGRPISVFRLADHV